MNPILVTVILCIVCVAAGIAAGFFAGERYRKHTAELAIGSAEEEAKRIVNDAIKSAEGKKKEAVLEGKDELHRMRSEADREINDRRKEIQRQERRAQQKEENLDRKLESLENKEDKLTKKNKQAEDRLNEAEDIKKQQLEKLERISGFTAEQAKEYLLNHFESELMHEKAVKLRDIEQQTKDEADSTAREVISMAIQRCAADHVSEATISVVPLPNDEMKGRIIGREGRNIRTIETLTGVDLIIDDTPEAITISSFDPVRREVARIALEKLIADGRIHPARIEETVEKARREVDTSIKQAGENAVLQTGITGIHPELIKLLGRLRYRTSYGQNVLEHSLEVASLAGIMASELGLDPTMARRAGLLHDIGKALDHEMEGSHVDIGVNVARKYKESEAVVHAIAAHHNDIEPKTVIACLVQAADAISAARPGARRENAENYIKRLEKLEEVASSFEGVERCYAIQAGREIRVIVKPEAISDDQMTMLAHDICKKIEADLEYPGQIKVNIIRESRAVDYAK
ncbi:MULTISPECIES: ribonuclease Y [Caproicibacterium]|mgnify:CR=1 FL=1|uniref:Ribonuclease Y n=1 Tax=Caproicibacterium lactatifermentans TaxID=2666138 RepID=A0A859DSA6_9FIRM|nr:ribonuclease Y [Caproicibacterium lactatifermentans]ARP49698.1 ribonuclease Y [Ruminococcaceae bacterium CPB6]MDD4807668.1 ribonuclease Y [Oscillospiraceae bacterium]QKN24566.1 ribonuclease Y [Caproicibacterium lactatifermentans]QKO30418.1 ribonuclease Y [Caproicibacterium lactatifermentans]